MVHSLLCVRPALADNPRVAVAVLDCPTLDDIEIRRIVRLELSAAPPDDGRATTDATFVTIQCRESIISIQVLDPTTGKWSSREFDVRRTAVEGRNRLVALAAVELVSSSWSELQANPAPSIVSLGASASSEQVEAAREAVGRRLSPLDHQLSVTPLVMTFLAPAFPLWGGSVELANVPTDLFGWSVEVAGVHGTTGVTLGDATVNLISTSVSAMFLMNADRLSVATSAGPRLGFGWIHGSPDAQESGTDLTATWSGLCGKITLGYTLTRMLGVHTRFEAGYTLRSIEGQVNNNTEVRVSGLWLAGGLGIDLLL